LLADQVRLCDRRLWLCGCRVRWASVGVAGALGGLGGSGGARSRRPFRHPACGRGGGVWYWEETPVVGRPGRAVCTQPGGAWVLGPQGGRGRRPGLGRGRGPVSVKEARLEEKSFAPSKFTYSPRSRPLLIPLPYPPLRMLPRRPRPCGASRACCGGPRSPRPLRSRGRPACCRRSRRARRPRACLWAPLLVELDRHVGGRA